MWIEILASFGAGLLGGRWLTAPTDGAKNKAKNEIIRESAISSVVLLCRRYGDSYDRGALELMHHHGLKRGDFDTDLLMEAIANNHKLLATVLTDRYGYTMGAGHYRAAAQRCPELARELADTDPHFLPHLPEVVGEVISAYARSNSGRTDVPYATWVCDKAGVDAHALPRKVIGTLATDVTGSVLTFLAGRGATEDDFDPGQLERQLHNLYKAGAPMPLDLSAAKKEDVVARVGQRRLAILADLERPRPEVEAELAAVCYAELDQGYSYSSPDYDVWVAGQNRTIRELDVDGFTTWVRTAVKRAAD